MPAAPTTENEPPTGGRRLWLYFSRAVRLRCPHCGRHPLFIPFWKTRSLRDWFTPLDGCPRCGYPYEREIGYFLMSIWAVGYGFGSLFGLAVYFYLDMRCQLPFAQVLAITVAAVLLFAFVFARHAKSLFLAFDHFVDPPVRDFDDDSERDAPAQPIPIAPLPASRTPTDVIKPR